jgi:threonyl-tRNA synthetase
VGEGTVNVRKRGEKEQEALTLEEFAGRMRAEMKARDSYRRR